jgi:hypothetical protein
MKRVKLRELGHARAGDKGDTSVIGFFVYDPANFDLLRRLLTVDRVRRHFQGLVGKVHRFEVPSLQGFNFVMEEALGGGVNVSLSIDPHGKSRSSFFLDIELVVPDETPLRQEDNSQVGKGNR